MLFGVIDVNNVLKGIYSGSSIVMIGFLDLYSVVIFDSEKK